MSQLFWIFQPQILFHEHQNKWKMDEWERKKADDHESLKMDQNQRKKDSRAKIRADDEKKFKEDMRGECAKNAK